MAKLPWLIRRQPPFPMRDSNDDPLSRRTVLGVLGSIAPAFLGSPMDAIMRRIATAVGQQSDELPEMGARDAVDRIRSGDLSAEAYVARLLRQNEGCKALNLVNAIDAERVSEAARAMDVARARGAKLGPAAGLPFAVKDQISVAGYPTTAGNGALRGYVPKRHAAVVDALVRAGAIPFCMTAVPDMTVSDGIMHQVSSHSDAFGAVHNPYDPGRIPGGSSGGSAGALAARIVPAALGLDTNGSI